MCFPRNISCKDPNHILAAIQGISSSHLILSTVQLSKEGNTHLDSYTYLFTVNVIMTVLLIHQQKIWKHFLKSSINICPDCDWQH